MASVWEWSGWGVLCVWGLVACHPLVAERSTHAVQASQYHIQLGLAYLQQGDLPRAKQKLLAALRVCPRCASAHAAMGYWLEQAGEMPRAKQYYQRALVLAPHRGAQQNNVGAFLCRTGQPEAGMLLLLQAARDIHYVHAAIAYENAGRCAMLMNDMKRGRLYFQRAVRHDPSRQDAFYAWVELTRQQGHIKEALHELRHYDRLVRQHRALLRLGMRVARQAHEETLVAVYQQRLQLFHLRRHHEHD